MFYDFCYLSIIHRRLLSTQFKYNIFLSTFQYICQLFSYFDDVIFKYDDISSFLPRQKTASRLKCLESGFQFCLLYAKRLYSGSRPQSHAVFYFFSPYFDCFGTDYSMTGSGTGTAGCIGCRSVGSGSSHSSRTLNRRCCIDICRE